MKDRKNQACILSNVLPKDFVHSVNGMDASAISSFILEKIEDLDHKLCSQDVINKLKYSALVLKTKLDRKDKKILCLDPAGESFGVALLHLIDGTIYVPMSFLLQAPETWDSTKKNNYMAHSVAALISLERPDVVVSEKPWGAGFSKDSLLQLIGAIKSETWANITWQGITEARRGVLGDGYGSSDKTVSAEWLLQYPFSISAKKLIKSQLDSASKKDKIGFDILDAILHGLYYLIDNELVKPVHKELKKKKKQKKGLFDE